MIRLPINKKWTQTNRGDTAHVSPYSNMQGLNTLAASFNLDLSTNYGRTRITKMLKTTDSTSNTHLNGVPVGFKYYRYASNNYIFTVAGNYVSANVGVDAVTFSQFTTATGFPTSCSSSYSDIELFDKYLYVTQSDENCFYLDGSGVGSNWANFNVAGTGDAGNPHMLCPYQNRMYCTFQGNKISSWSNSNSPVQPNGVGGANTVQFTIQLDPSLTIKWIRAASDKIWIGCAVNTNGAISPKRGVIFTWDGSSGSPTSSYRLEAAVPMACVVKDDIPYITDSNGRILTFNGGTFKEIARFPYRDRWPYNTINSANDTGFIHPNGMTINNGRINLLVKNSYFELVSGIYVTPEFLPSGVWEYDENIGLYHKFSPSYTDTTNYNINEYGQFNLSAVGGLTDMKAPDTFSGANGRFLAGAKIIIPNGGGSLSSTYGIFTDETAVTSLQMGANSSASRKAGYLVTVKLDSQNVTDMWQKLFLKYKQLLNSTDRIVGKYRTTEQAPTVISAIIWTSTTTFTTTDANMANYAVGDEVEVLAGRGGALCAHITTIALNAGTYTVTIDETVETTDATNYNLADIRLQKWIKLGADINDQVSQWKERAIGKDSTWIQFKIWMLWKGDNELDELLVSNTPSIKA